MNNQNVNPEVKKRYKIEDNVIMSDIQLTFAYYDYIKDYLDFRNVIFDIENSFKSLEHNHVSNGGEIITYMLPFYAKRLWHALNRLSQYEKPESYGNNFDKFDNIQKWQKFVQAVKQEIKFALATLKALKLVNDDSEDKKVNDFQIVTQEFYQLCQNVHHNQKKYEAFVVKLANKFTGLTFD